MSMAEHSPDPVQIAPDPDTLHLYHRQQLSAMLDGELSPDEAKFMLRRLEHDSELAQCWERWQICGEILRGRSDALLPSDFAARVAAAVQAPVPRAGIGLRARSRLLSWGGAALAASLALVVVSVLMLRPGPEAISGPGEVAVVEAADVLATPTPAAEALLAATPEPVLQVAVQALRAEVAAVALAPARPAHPARELLSPALTPTPMVPRPWPRAGAGSGALTVGYGAHPPQPLDPFQPRWSPPPAAGFWPEPQVHPGQVNGTGGRQD